MESVALWMEDFSDDSSPNERRTLRQSADIFSQSEESFVRNFRLTKDAFSYVLDEIGSELTKSRAHAISAKTKLATALKILGQGGYQHQIGEDRNTLLAQPTVSNCLTEVCSAIEKILCPKHIKFLMTEEEKNRAKHNFYERCKIPGVVMVVDGTHIQMIRPRENEHLYFNRKLKHSLNAMVVCDDEMRIRAINARYGGASHDSHVWNLSEERQYLKMQFDNGDRSSRLLGDSGYPLEPWLLTPYRNADDNTAETRFNTFTQGRCIIERTLGVLKGRFRCLLAARELHYSPKKVVKIINACCALHNICLDFKVPDPLPIFENELDLNIPEEIFNNFTGNYQNLAVSIRDEIKRNMR